MQRPVNHYFRHVRAASEHRDLIGVPLLMIAEKS
jgi:hypothetical protein